MVSLMQGDDSPAKNQTKPRRTQMITKPDFQANAALVRSASANAGVTREDMARNCPNREAANALWDKACAKVSEDAKRDYAYDIQVYFDGKVVDAFVASLKA